jgi:hypothetical protein
VIDKNPALDEFRRKQTSTALPHQPAFEFRPPPSFPARRPIAYKKRLQEAK